MQGQLRNWFVQYRFHTDLLHITKTLLLSSLILKGIVSTNNKNTVDEVLTSIYYHKNLKHSE